MNSAKAQGGEFHRIHVSFVCVESGAGMLTSAGRYTAFVDVLSKNTEHTQGAQNTEHTQIAENTEYMQDT